MIETNTLRKAQLIMLDMLIEFDALCQRHELQYWLDSGSLLGAVRHQGFIPWDDDIDISMPLEDYLRFKELGAKELSNAIYLQTSHRDAGFKFDYIKLRSNKASIIEFHEKDQEINYHQGVFVDVFPMLNIENTDKNHQFYKDTLKQIRKVSAISLHTPEGKDEPQRRAELIDELKQRHLGWDKAKTSVIYGGEMPDVASVFELEDIFPLRSLSFETYNFPVPHDSSKYLDAIYSFDYRQLPPENQRKIHAHSISFTNEMN
jgi:lipopolysaccharide cholinephosphotransferase